jgi:hypothetical protein
MKHRAFVQSRWRKLSLPAFLSMLIFSACLAGNVCAAPAGGYASDVSISGPLYVGCKAASRIFSIPKGTRVQAGSVFIGWNDSPANNWLEISGDAMLVVTDACSRPSACEVRRGTLWLNNGEVVSDSISVWQNSVLGGQGTVSATTLCEGTLSPGSPIGTLVQNGNLALSPSASAGFEIGGYKSDSEFDRVVVDGRLCLAGTLNLSLVNGFIPRGGDRFMIMTGSSVSGSFSDVFISNCPPELAADVIVDDASVTIVFGVR